MLTRIRYHYSCLSLSRRSLKLGFRILINESFIYRRRARARNLAGVFTCIGRKRPQTHIRAKYILPFASKNSELAVAKIYSAFLHSCKNKEERNNETRIKRDAVMAQYTFIQSFTSVFIRIVQSYRILSKQKRNMKLCEREREREREREKFKR